MSFHIFSDTTLSNLLYLVNPAYLFVRIPVLLDFFFLHCIISILEIQNDFYVMHCRNEIPSLFSFVAMFDAYLKTRKNYSVL